MNPARGVFCIFVVAEKGVFYHVDAFPVLFNLAKYRILQLPINWKQQIITSEGRGFESSFSSIANIGNFGISRLFWFQFKLHFLNWQIQ